MIALVAVDVSSGRLPLRIAIAAVTDLRERFVDVVIQSSVLPDVDLVTVGMRVGAGRVSCERVRWLTAHEAVNSRTDLSTACDRNRGSRCFLKGNHSIDHIRVDTVERSASSVRLVGAAAARENVNAHGGETGGRFSVSECGHVADW